MESIVSVALSARTAKYGRSFLISDRNWASPTPPKLLRTLESTCSLNKAPATTKNGAAGNDHPCYVPYTKGGLYHPRRGPPQPIISSLGNAKRRCQSKRREIQCLLVFVFGSGKENSRTSLVFPNVVFFGVLTLVGGDISHSSQNRPKGPVECTAVVYGSTRGPF